MLRTAVTLAIMAAALSSGPLAAQEQPEGVAEEAAEVETRSAEEMIEAAREALRPPSVRRRIAVAAEPGTIVVTAEDPEAQRLENSTADELVADAAATARTPCAGCIEPSGAGVRIGFGQPPPPALLIDLKAIPEAPPGSDAARYAEAP